MSIVGTAEWANGPSNKILRIFLEVPEILAKEIYQWATENLLLGSMATLYELYAGEDRDTGTFHAFHIAIVVLPKIVIRWKMPRQRYT